MGSVCLFKQRETCVELYSGSGGSETRGVKESVR